MVREVSLLSSVPSITLHDGLNYCLTLKFSDILG